MRLEIFRTLWGYRGSWQQALDEALGAGFDGIEARIPETAAQRAINARLLREYNVPYIATLFTSTPVLPRQSDSPHVHLEDLRIKLDWAAELGPRLVNVLPGNDRWALSEQVDFFARAVELVDASGLKVCFEIHRGRSLYSPWVTLDVIRQVPELRFTSDISHWLVTCERLLDDPADDLSAFIERVDHIQARRLRPGPAGATPRRAGIRRGAGLPSAPLGKHLEQPGKARPADHHNDPRIRPRRLPAPPALHRRAGGRPVAAQPVDGAL